MRTKIKGGNKKICIVATSIFDGKFLGSYTKKMTDENVVDRTTLIVIPDRKTPSELYLKCKIYKDLGFNIICPTLEEQDEYLKKLGAIYNIIPYDSDSRRNIGYLMAYERGDEIIISVDDDNYPINSLPYFSEHEIVGNTSTKQAPIETDSGWFNECNLLKFTTKTEVYARGFPYYSRFDVKNDEIHDIHSKINVHINSGLWLKSPDVDAITWLGLKPQATAFKNKSLVLGKNTWTPINSQNTSLNRAVMPSYWFVKMGYPVSGLSIDRYGDIFSGYFAEACAKHLGYGIRVGSPIINHVRNSHHPIKDLNYEFSCVVILEDILKWLTSVKLNGSTYKETYLSLASQMEDAVQSMEGFIWNSATRGYFHHLAYCMRVWINTIKILDGSK